MKKQIIIFLSILTILFSNSSAHASDQTSELAECVVITHCVRINYEVTNVTESFNKVKDIVINTPRTKIINENNSYIHAEAETRWMHYIDDLEIKAIPERKILQLRSESRVGVGDNGVNRKRIDKLISKLMTISIR